MEFHAVKNPAAPPPLLSAFFSFDLAFFIVALGNRRREFALTLESPAPFWYDQRPTKFIVYSLYWNLGVFILRSSFPRKLEIKAR